MIYLSTCTLSADVAVLTVAAMLTCPVHAALPSPNHCLMKKFNGQKLLLMVLSQDCLLTHNYVLQYSAIGDASLICLESVLLIEQCSPYFLLLSSITSSTAFLVYLFPSSLAFVVWFNTEIHVLFCVILDSHDAFVLDLDLANKDRRTRNGTQLNMILARVLLGRVFVCQAAKQYKRAPCSCNEDRCTDTSHRASAYHSVLGTHKEPSTRLKFREFVVYDKCHSYPEFLIEYTRT